MLRKVLILVLIFQLSSSVKIKQTQRNSEFTDWRIGQKSRENGAYAENIKCDKNDDLEEFSAVVTLPVGFGTIPVFNEASNVNPSISDICVIKQNIIGSNKFSVKISDFEMCGVQTQKGSDGSQWMSVSLRFPLIGSLRTAEDEIITLVCRPQDRIIVRNHVLDLQSQLSNPSRTVFSSSPLNFDCNLEVLVKSDENSFIRLLPNEDTVEVGQEIQLKATVRAGDGWKFATLKDVTVHKVTPLASNQNSQSFSSLNSLRQIMNNREQQTLSGSSSSSLSSISPSSLFSNSIQVKKSSNQRLGKNSGLNREKRQIPDAAFLVLSDGCRNPVFRSVALNHPTQDSDNNLVVRFNFNAFMFQDMEENGPIRITAKVIACVEEEDCRPNRCLDDEELGFGKRRKRSPIDLNNRSLTEDFTKELNLKVVMPRFRSAFVNSEGSSVINEWFNNLNENECQNAIYLIGMISLMFCFVLTFTSFIILIKLKTNKH